MTYTLIGELSLINQEIDKILKEINSTSIIKYDLENTSILNVIDDLNTINLFEDKKIIICHNLLKNDNDEVLINYLKNQSDNVLILCDENSLDERKRITKELKNNKYIELNNNDLTNYIKNSLSDYEIDNISISLLKSYCNNNYNRLKNEINKLKMYKLEDKKIVSEDIKKIIKKDLDKNVFDLTDAINKNDKKKIFAIYYDLLANNEDELKILALLANHFRTLYRVKELVKIEKDSEVMKLLDIKHPYRLKILKEQSVNYDSDDLLRYLKELSDIDIKIKSGKADKKVEIELFLTKIME